MRQVVSDKYNVAWFKLADCIARGEKERALGVYRLLSHSFDDPALVCQLQADILLSFKDEKAQEIYQQAAQLYRERNRFLEAAAVYEHLATLDPHTLFYRTEMISLYQQLGIISKVTHYVQQLIDYLLERDQWQKAIGIVDQYDTATDLPFTAQLHEQMFFYLLNKDVLPDTIIVHAKKALDAWMELDNQQAIKKMLTKLKATNEKMYEYVSEYWQQKG